MIKLEEIHITQEMLAIITKIEAFNGAWPYMIKSRESLKTILSAQTKLSSIASSARIEGCQLKDYEVEMVLGGMYSSNFKEKDVLETRGYASVFDRIREDYEVLNLNETLIKEFHSTLVQDTSKEEYRKTEKPEQNILAGEPAIDNVSSELAPKLLHILLEDTNNALKQGYNPLLVASAFTANFISINPFGEGNGRLARLITTLILLKSGYNFLFYASFEPIVEESRKSYMFALKKSQSKDEENIWFLYMLRVFEKAALRLEGRMQKDEYLSKEEIFSQLSPIEKDIITAISNKGAIYTTDLLATLDQHKAPTIKKALKALVEKGHIVMNGKGRGTYYEIYR